MAADGHQEPGKGGAFWVLTGFLVGKDGSGGEGGATSIFDFLGRRK